jgi:hypothetical protein
MTEKSKNTIRARDFQVRSGKKVVLSKWPTKGKPVCASKDDYQIFWKSTWRNSVPCNSFITPRTGIHCS